jgi:hypothetical protein
MACQIPKDLDLSLHLFCNWEKKPKFIDVVYQVEVGYWAQRNFLQYYKIYVTMICMFDKDFFNSL